MTTATAAIARGGSELFSIEQVTLEAPRANEVVVRFEATGLCHTDLDAAMGRLPAPQPVVLGHEGVGIVEEVGSAVTSVKPGQRVLMVIDSCGDCLKCQAGHTQYCDLHFPLNFLSQRLDGTTSMRDANGEVVHDHFFGQSSLATHAIVAERSIIPVQGDVASTTLAPMACGVLTGAGAVFNRLKIAPGSSVAVYGTGTVGLSAVLAAHVAGASRVIAVDIVPSRLELAKELGATDVVDGNAGSVREQIAELTGGVGTNYAVEAGGVLSLMEDAVAGLAPLGEAVLLGFASMEADISINVFQLLQGRTVSGAVMSHVSPHLLVPELVKLHQAGRFPVEKLVSTYSLARINDAVADVHDGKTVKAVIDHTS